MPDQSTSGFPESLSDFQTKNNRLCSKLIYVPLSPQSSSASVVFLGSMAARHQHICFCGAVEEGCVPAQLLSSEGKSLTVKSVTKKV